MKSKLATLLTLFTLGGTCAVPAHAALVSYADNASGFVAASGATSIGALPGSGGNGTVVGKVTFTSAPGSAIAFNNYSNEMAGNDLGVSGVENFNIAIAGGAYAFGFSVHEPTYNGTNSGSTGTWGCNAPCFDTSFQFEFFDGTTSLGTFLYNAPDDNGTAAGGPVGFFGVTSDVAFDRVQVRDLTNTIDNEIFGSFLAGYTPPSGSTVPEPSTLALAAGCVAALLLTRPRRRS